MVGDDSTGPDLQLVGARFLNFLSGKLSREFKLRQYIVDISRNSNGHISVVRDATVTCLGTMVERDLVYTTSEPDFRISFDESYHESSNVAEYRYFTKFK